MQNIQSLIKAIKSVQSFFPLDKLMQTSLLDFWHLKYNYNSNAIEGTTLSEGETAQVLRGKTVPNHRLVEHLEVINHKKAFDFILHLANFPQIQETDFSQVFTEENILKIHSILLTNIQDEYAGIYRRQNVRIAFSNTILPNYTKVPDLMGEFIDQYVQKSKKVPIENYEAVLKFGYELHLDFVKIHPFVDGNGRTARLVMNLWFLCTFGNINSVYVKQRDQYIDALETSATDKQKYYDCMSQNFLQIKQEELSLLENKEIFKY